MTAAEARRQRTFQVELIKPSHYDDDGYVIQWRKAWVPSNSLSSVFGITLDIVAQGLLGDVELKLNAYDETNTVIPIEDIVRRLAAADGEGTPNAEPKGIVCMIGVQSNQFPRAMDMARRFRAAGIQVAIGGFHASGCIAMLPELPADLQEALDLGVTLFAGEAEGGRLAEFYQDAIAGTLPRGATPEEAREWVVWWYSRGPISEGLAVGSLATGVVSNADLASNYAGMKFYENLTEPTMLKGEERPALLVLRDGVWRLNFHVRPESGFMAPFFSDHFNEALNPNIYEFGMRGPIKRHVRKISDRVLAFYAGEDGQPRSREWFEDTAVELRTLYGEDYGVFVNEDVMFTIADLCMEPAEESEATDSPAEDDPVVSDAPSPTSEPDAEPAIEIPSDQNPRPEPESRGQTSDVIDVTPPAS